LILGGNGVLESPAGAGKFFKPGNPRQQQLDPKRQEFCRIPDAWQLFFVAGRQAWLPFPVCVPSNPSGSLLAYG
jgi:hypothetical protein